MSDWIRSAAIGAATLAATLVIAMTGAITVLHEPRHAALAIAQYLLISGGLTLGLGIVGIALGMRFLPHLSLKVGLGYAVSSAAAIITILWTPLLMFKETQDLYLLALLLVCFLVISLGLAAIISITVSHRIAALQQAARDVAAGRFDTRVQLSSRDELAHLGDAFNRMSEEIGLSFERLRAMEQERRDLVAAISHDLRTPLAAMRVMVEAMQDGVVDDPATIAQYHAGIRHEIDRLERLINDLFELSRLESGVLKMDVVAVNLSEFLEDTIGTLKTQAERQGVRIVLHVPERLEAVRVDPLQLQRVITNLVQNAIRHTPEGGVIHVLAASQGDTVTVRVEDSGEGIVPDDLPHIFDRFYRGEKSRARHTGGAGLGLAISKAIVEAHRGRIWAESEPRHGARFVFTLPRR